MLEHAIEKGRGGVYLRTDSEQYARLRRALSHCAPSSDISSPALDNLQ